MDATWQLVAAIGLVWTVLTLVQAAACSFEPQDLDPKGAAIGLVLGFAGYGAYVALTGMELKGEPALVALVAGVVIGYVSSFIAGYEDDYGYAVAKDSGWFLAPWGISAGVALWGAIDTSGSAIAIGLLGMVASLGAGLGQFVFAFMAVRKVESALDQYLDIEWQAEGVEATPQA